MKRSVKADLLDRRAGFTKAKLAPKFDDHVEQFLFCGQSSSTNEDARTSRLELQNTKTIFSGKYLDEITSEMVDDFKSARKHEVRRKAKESRLVTGTTVNRALETHYNRSSELMRIIRKLLKRVVRPERFELPTLWFEAMRESIRVIKPSLYGALCLNSYST